MTTAPTLILGLIGHAGAGKTTLADAVARAYGDAAVVGFGDATRRRAVAEGADPSDRDVLARIGQRWVDEDPAGFCEAVLKQQLDPVSLLIIEGIRHKLIKSTLERLVSPSPAMFVHLKAPRRELVSRIEDEGKSEQEAMALLSDPTENEVDRYLLSVSDVVLDATASVDENAGQILELVYELEAGTMTSPAEASESGAGWLDTDQRQNLIEAVSAEWELMLRAGVTAATGIGAAQLKEMHNRRELLALSIGGRLLYPAFVLKGPEFEPRVRYATTRLAPIMSDWEIVAWLIANNGVLDGIRPIDATQEEVSRAVAAELGAA
jgi:dephospho-CoA kinase